jgi:hypothetical protein
MTDASIRWPDRFSPDTAPVHVVNAITVAASGDALEPVIERMFEAPEVAYIHAHNAGRGCYAARIDRA